MYVCIVLLCDYFLQADRNEMKETSLFPMEFQDSKKSSSCKMNCLKFLRFEGVRMNKKLLI